MELQGGGEKVFPLQLLTVRRSRNGTIRSILLTSENSDYCTSVVKMFKSSIGMKRETIESNVKLIELKAQNPKIIKGLSLIMFRISGLAPPSAMDAPSVRKEIFLLDGSPAISPSEREQRIGQVADRNKVSSVEIERAIYSDKESEQILLSVPDIDENILAQKFNLEQIETVMLKSVNLNIRTSSVHSRLIRRIRSLGLLYTDSYENETHTISVSGPLSVLQHSERYGSSIALLVRYMVKFSGWELDADIILKSDQKKTSYRYHLDDSVSQYVESSVNWHPGSEQNGLEIDPAPVKIGSTLVFPDYLMDINGIRVNILITRPRYFEEDNAILQTLRKEGKKVEMICVIKNKETCPRGGSCIKGEVNFESIRKVVSGKPSRENRKRKEPEEGQKQEYGVQARKTVSIDAKTMKHLENLYPDSQAMVDFLDFIGISPDQGLTAAGYTVRWKGLRIVVSK